MDFLRKMSVSLGLVPLLFLAACCRRPPNFDQRFAISQQ